MPKDEKIVEPIAANLDDVVDSIFSAEKQKGKTVASEKGSIGVPLRKTIAGAADRPLKIGNAEIDCYVLDDETRVLSQRGMFRGLGTARGGPRNENEPSNTGAELPRFASQKWISPYITNELALALKSPIRFQPPTGGEAYGYPADILVDICDAIVEAYRQGDTGERQQGIVDNALILIRGFAKVGIIALVDEATGYQHDRGHNALRLLLEKYIADGLQKWIHTFPNSFFAELDRLYDNDITTPRSRPQYYGGFINKYVYEPIEHGYVKSKLNELNIMDSGKRRARFHQWLTDEGRIILTRQIGKVEGIMEMCDNIEHFKQVVRKQKAISIAPYLFDEMNKII